MLTPLKGLQWFFSIVILSHIQLTYANENTVFLYNRIENCKSSEYYDVNYFMCRECDPQLNLMPSKNGLQCECDRKSVTKVEYDTNLRQPICSALNCTNAIECGIQMFSPLLRSSQQCGLEHLVEVVATSPPSKSIQIQRIPAQSTNKNQTSNLTCSSFGVPPFLSSYECVDTKNYVRFKNYCIPNYLIKDFLNYKQFKTLAAFSTSTTAAKLFDNLEYLVFLCQTMKMTESCEHIANLCVVTVYNLDKFSPCNIFYTAQTTVVSAGTDSYQTKLVPFLFYAKGRSTTDDLDKVIEHRYKYTKYDANHNSDEYEMFTPYPTTNRISMLLVAHELNGELKTIQPLKTSDLDLCGMHQQHINFGENLASACQLDLRTLIDLGEQKPWFLNLYLNYTENNQNLVKAVPILIQNAFTYNMNPYDREKWQLVKRIFLVDTFTGRNKTYRSHLYAADNYFEKYINFRYVKRIELQFQLNENHYYFGNKISVPLLIIEYGNVEMSDFQWTSDLDVSFEFRVTFMKSFTIGIFIHILFTVAIATAFGMAIFQTLSFKRRKQQNDIDSLIMFKFLINCCSTMGTVLFCSAAFLTVYVYFVYKTQHVVKVLPPFSELRLIKCFFIFAFILKAIKFGHYLSQQINCDVFFIDWERPRVFEHQITLKSTNNLDTPSICSSGRQYQQNDGLSAWRMYFVANEWIKLATKRKCSIGIQILMVLITIIVFRFDWSHMFSFKSIFHWPWTPDADRIIQSGRTLEMLAVALIVYSICYVVQRAFNFLIYERYILNSVQQFIDICSMSNISMFIFVIDSYGYYIHGRSPHGFADTDMCSMLQQLRRESENMCGHRGLLPNSEHQTFCFLAPLQLRTFYNKLKSTLRKSMDEKDGPQNHQQISEIETVSKFFEQNLQQIAHTNTTINRFLSAFIDHGLKDLDYIIQEKTILEYVFDFEFDSNITENRGTFYMDKGHSFDSIVFYGNEQLLFQVEMLLFICFIILSGNFLFAILLLGIVSEILQHTMRLFVKKNLSNQTLIDEKFLI